MVNLTCHADRTELTFEGALDVSAARAAYESLNGAIVRALPIELCSAELKRIDAAGLQLLTAFLLAVRERGLSLRWQSVGAVLADSADLLALSQPLELHR